MRTAIDQNYSTANSSTPLRLNKEIDRKLRPYQHPVAHRTYEE